MVQIFTKKLEKTLLNDSITPHITVEYMFPARCNGFQEFEKWRRILP